MKFHAQLSVCLLQIVLNFSCMAMKNGAHEDAHIPGDYQLYEETNHYLNPNDMLTDFSARREALKKKRLPQDGLEGQKGPDVNSPVCKNIQAELSTCNTRQEILEKELQSKEATVRNVLGQLASQRTVNYESHYKRFLSLLLQALRTESETKEEDGSFVQPLTFVFAEHVLTGLEYCVQNKAPSGEDMRQCDELLTMLFHDVEVRDDLVTYFDLVSYFDWPTINIVSILKKCTLALGVVLLGLLGWASMLLISDVYRNRRWMPFVMLMLVLTFLFCCLWNWSIMIKELEAQRAADMARDGAGGPPEECQSDGWWAGLMGYQAKCTKYYTEAFILASEQITLEQVVVRTMTSLFLTPLRSLGRESGLFFNEFYSNMSILYIVPASIMFILFVALALFFCCRNTGGNTKTYQHQDSTMDALAHQMRRENQELLLQSRAMLENIGVALHASAQRAEIVQPLLDSSCRRIEHQLDSLIAARFEALTQRSAPPLPPPAQQGSSKVAVYDGTLKSNKAPRTADLTDGSCSKGRASSQAASDGDLVEEVIAVVDESLSESQLEEKKTEQSEEDTHSTIIQRKVKRKSTPLAPSSKKFLQELREALNS